MKIGIVTLFGYFNHGNRLQNYALQHVLEGLGMEVCTFAAIRKENRLKCFVKKYIEKTSSGYQIISRNSRIRSKNFKSFSDKYIKSQVLITRDGIIPAEYTQDVSVFVAGSDQVWNPLLWTENNKQAEMNNYLLAFTSKRKIAYAASFGTSDLPEQWEKKMRPLFVEFDAISVREEDGKGILQRMQIESSVVGDPTLLLTADEWREIEEHVVPLNMKYALCYFLGEQPDDVINQIRQNAISQDMNVIDLMDERNPYYCMGPQAFIELIDKAEIVYTDSFHACVFSILFHTPFSVFSRNHSSVKNMGSRIATLLKKTGFEEEENAQLFFVHSDFSCVDEHLAEIRKEANGFIRNTLMRNQ